MARSLDADKMESFSLFDDRESVSTGPRSFRASELEGDYVELNQLLKLAGICDSGGAGKMIVASGDVKVDGKTELRKTCKVRAGQVVTVGDVTIRISPGN